MLAFTHIKLIFLASFIIHSESTSGYDTSTDSTAEADPGKSAPNDSLHLQQGRDKGTKNYSLDHTFTGNLKKMKPKKNQTRGPAKSGKSVKADFMDLDSPEDDPIIVVDKKHVEGDDTRISSKAGRISPLAKKINGTKIQRKYVDIFSKMSSDEIDAIVDKIETIANKFPVQTKVASNFLPLLADPVFEGVNISIPHKVVEKSYCALIHALVTARVLASLLGIAFLFFSLFFLFAASFLGLSMEKVGDQDDDGVGISSKAGRISPLAKKINETEIQKADLVDVVTISIPSLIGDDFIKETIRVEYEWRPPSYDVFKQNLIYEPMAATSEPNKGATNVGNKSKSSSMVKSTGNYSKKGNITTSNSYCTLEYDEEEDEEHVENVSLPTELKELPTKFNKLAEDVKGLKNQFHKLEIELPGDLKEISTKLEDFTKSVTSLTSQVAELKTLQWELPTEFLPPPTQIASNARDTSVPSAGHSGTIPDEGEKNINQTLISQLFQRRADKNAKKTNLKNDLNQQHHLQLQSFLQSSQPQLINNPPSSKVHQKAPFDLRGSRPMKTNEKRLSGSSKKKKWRKFDYVTESGDNVYLTEEQINAQKKIEEEVKAEAAKQEGEIQTRMDYLHQTKEELGIDLEKPLCEQDTLDKLNDLANKKKKHADDIHDYLRANKRLKSSVQYEDHLDGTVLNKPVLDFTKVLELMIMSGPLAPFCLQKLIREI
nr:hypothetical protein [Tanacetum cinerariifolium]